MSKLCFSNSSDHALTAYLVKNYNQMTNRPLGRTILQKLCYLAKAKGIPFSFSFDIYHYGPFAADLFSLTEDLISDQIVLDESADRSISKYVPGPACDQLLAQKRTKLTKHKNGLNQIIDIFRGMSPQQLELITTVHYIYCSGRGFGNPKKESVIKTVFQIKKGKFPVDTIRTTFDALNQAGLLNWKPAKQ